MKRLSAPLLLAAFPFLTVGVVSLSGTEASQDANVAKPDATAPSKTLLESYTNCVGMEFKQVGKFWAGIHEVTQAAYEKVMGANPSQCPGAGKPVDSVSWNDARDFCNRLTALDRDKGELPPGYSYVLPTEDQWQTLVGDATMADAVTSLAGACSCSAPVGSLRPNNLGLYDVRGNLWEWCAGNTDKPYRVLRGGGWDSRHEVQLRLEFRWYSRGPEEQGKAFGFRCLLVSQPGA